MWWNLWVVCLIVGGDGCGKNCSSYRDAGRSWQLTALENVCSCGRLFQWDDDSICGTIKRRHVCSTMVCTEKDWPLNAYISRSTMSYYYCCYASFNAPCAGHKDVESQELLWTCASRRLFYFFFSKFTDMIQYDTWCYFNVRSKADMSQLNLPHGTDN